MRTRSIGVIWDSTVRIGLIFSVEPSQARAAPTRPPRRRNSIVSIANHIFRCSRASLHSARASTPESPRRAAAAATMAMNPSPPQAVAESMMKMRSPPLPSSSRRCLACEADSHVPDRPAARCTETISRPSASSGS